MTISQETGPLHEVTLTEARNLSPLYTEAVRDEHPVVIRRGRDERGVLLAHDQLAQMLALYALHTHVIPEEEDGGFTLWVDELALGAFGATLPQAHMALLVEVRAATQHFFKRWHLYRHLPDRAARYPYYLRLALADDAEFGRILSPAPHGSEQVA